MSAIVCKNGHASDTDDYCSVCGVAIDPASSSTSAPSSAAPPPPANACPECGTPRTDLSARYCEVCRHDFQAGSAPPVVPAAANGTNSAAAAFAATPIAPADPPNAPSVSDPPTAAPATTVPTATDEVVVTVDPTLDAEPDPSLPCPIDEPEHRFPLDLPQLLIGRRDDRRDIHPEIPVRDPAVSHRHAQLLRLPDGSVAIRDLASTNGTFVNGNEIPPGTSYVLQPGDVITIGRWTKIVVARG
jgi:hypothetical protein